MDTTDISYDGKFLKNLSCLCLRLMWIRNFMGRGGNFGGGEVTLASVGNPLCEEVGCYF